MDFRAIALLLVIYGTAAASDDQAWPEGSAMEVGQSLAANRDYFAGLVERKQSELVALVTEGSTREIGGRTHSDERLVRALEGVHTAWLAYYAHECELIGALTGAGGSWPSTYAVQCQANLMYRRFRRLKFAVRCIERIPVEDRVHDLNQCLYQLSPLTYGKES